MLKVLVKKQLSEVFKGYFYDAKRNRMRPKWKIAAWFIFFIVIMAGFLGGTFTALSLALCGGFTAVGMGWMYFLVMSGIAVLLGAFGSVFNTYSGLYLSKDNDLLLSLPIPVRTIIASRLINVYLMGTMYSATVLVPALIVYWVICGATVSRVACGILLFGIVTVFVLLLSCVLGWVVARISLKLKNRSFITVLISLLFIGAYYFFYFRANDMIRDILSNAETYGEKIKGAAYGLYWFGRIGEGDWLAAAVFAAVMALLAAGIWTVLLRSFLSIATASGNTEKVRYTEKTVREKTVFGALVGKEFARFASSANYMLNCGFGILLLPAFGVLFLIKGQEICQTLDVVFAGRPDSAAILVCMALCLMTAMIDMAVPSVSLEGKSLWIPRSLPVSPKTVLRAKMSVQMILAGIPMLIAAGCAAAAVQASPAVRVLLVVLPVMYTVFSAVGGTALGVRMPVMNWTSELAPIKQSGAVVLFLFGSWGISVLFAGVYFLIGYRIGAAPYMLTAGILLAGITALLLKWLDSRGSDAFLSLPS